jgi:hypothetical protein
MDYKKMMTLWNLEMGDYLSGVEFWLPGLLGPDIWSIKSSAEIDNIVRTESPARSSKARIHCLSVLCAYPWPTSLTCGLDRASQRSPGHAEQEQGGYLDDGIRVRTSLTKKTRLATGSSSRKDLISPIADS